MRDLSLKGITRRFLHSTSDISVKRHVLTFGTRSLRQRLESLARQEHSFDVSECIYGWTASYRQVWSHVTVRIRLDPDAGITAATMATLQQTWETTIESRWSNIWGLGRDGEATCPITFNVRWVTEDEHHGVRVRAGPERSNMTNWDTLDTGAVAAHEFGHMLGNPDEYPDDNCPDRSPVSSGTIMDDNSNNIPARLLQRIADEVGSQVVDL